MKTLRKISFTMLAFVLCWGIAEAALLVRDRLQPRTLEEEGGLRLVFRVPNQSGPMNARRMEELASSLRARIEDLRLDADDVTISVRRSEVLVDVLSREIGFVEVLRSILVRNAQLEVRAVRDDHDVLAQYSPSPPIETLSETVPSGAQVQRVRYLAAPGLVGRSSLETAIRELEVPSGTQFVLGRTDRDDGQEGWRTYLVSTQTLVTGDHVDEATAAMDQGSPIVSVEFDREGKELFRAATAANVNKRLAIMLDGRVESAPVVMSEIREGRVQISMGAHASEEQALRKSRDLAIILKAGSLPMPLELSDERIVQGTGGRSGPRGSFLRLGAAAILSVFASAAFAFVQAHNRG